MEKFKVHIALKAIISTEKLLKKPFSKVDLKIEEDLLAFLYCVVLHSNDTRLLFDEFKSVLQANKKLRSELVDEFDAEAKRIEQFRQWVEAEVETKSEVEEDGGFVKDLVWYVIVAGKLSPEYVLNQMGIEELPEVVEVVNRVNRDEYESRRLFTFLQMLPHMDTKKIKTPQDLYPFPWETEEMKKQAKKDLEANKEMFEKFMNGEIKFQ